MKGLLSTILMLSLLAPSARAQIKNPDTYTYLTISDADSLDAAWSYDTASHNVILNIYEPLFFYDRSSTEKLVPLIAEKVPSKANGLISADGRTYTIPIRKGVKFHDGAPLTPEDVRYSLLRFMLQDRAAGPSSLLMEPLLGYPSTRELKDGQEVLRPGVYQDALKAVTLKGDNLVLRLPTPYAPLLTILATWAPVLSRSWAAKNGDWDGSEAAWTKYNNPRKESSPFFERANGTGPFKLDRWDRKNKECVLLRHDGYWRGPAKLQRVIIKGVNEFSTRKLMLQAGDADAIYADRSVYSQLQNIPGVMILDGLPTMEMNPVVYFTFKINPVANPNMGSGKLDGDGIPPDFFSDVDLRKAFAYSFDYQGFIKDVMRGKGKQATGAVPESLPGHNPAQPVFTLDLAKAKQHFQKAWAGSVWEKGFRFTLSFNSGNVPRQNICQIIKRNVEGLNPKFRVDVRAIEWPAFLDAYKSSKLPIFAMGWNADYPDAHNFAFPLLHSKGDFPSTQKYANPKLDELIDAANRETDAAKRRKLYARIQAIEHDDVPHFVILDQVRFRTQREWVQGWYHNAVFPDSPYGSYMYPIHKAMIGPKAGGR